MSFLDFFGGGFGSERGRSFPLGDLLKQIQAQRPQQQQASMQPSADLEAIMQSQGSTQPLPYPFQQDNNVAALQGQGALSQAMQQPQQQASTPLPRPRPDMHMMPDGQMMPGAVHPAAPSSEAAPLGTPFADAWDNRVAQPLNYMDGAKATNPTSTMTTPPVLPTPPAATATPASDYLSYAAGRESGGNYNAQNPLSSAGGKYQFIKSTWDQVSRSHPELGLTADGRKGAQPWQKDQQERAMQAFTADNSATLQSAGLPVNNGSLYLAHRFGAEGAKGILGADPGTPAGQHFSADVMSANPDLKGKTLGQIIANSGGKSMNIDASLDFMQSPGGYSASAKAPDVSSQPSVPTAGGTGGSPQPNLTPKQQDKYEGFIGQMLGIPAGTSNKIAKTLQQSGAALMAIHNPSGASVLAKMAQEDDAGKWQVIYKNGKLIRVNAKTGQVETVADYGPDASDSSAERYLSPQVVTGPDGKQRLVQFTNQGGQKDTGYSPGKVTQRDLGDSIGTFDASGNLVGRTPKNLQEAKRQEALGGGIGKTEAERLGGYRKAESALSQLDTQSQVVADSVDKAISLTEQGTGPFGLVPTTGLSGAALGAVPGNNAYDLAKQLAVIKANIGFDKLQSMREASPTGGALGQVSDFENKLLQAVQGTLDQGVGDTELLQENLKRIKTLYGQVMKERRDAFRKDYGDIIPQRGIPRGGQSDDNDPLGIR